MYLHHRFSTASKKKLLFGTERGFRYFCLVLSCRFSPQQPWHIEIPAGGSLSLTCVLMIRQIKITQTFLRNVKLVQPTLSFNWKTAAIGNDINSCIEQFCHGLLRSCITIQTVLIILYPIVPQAVTSHARQGHAWLG